MPRDIGPWSLNKLRLLQLYLPGYLQASTAARDRIYIDAFAGPGKNRIKETGELVDGSPLIALGAQARDNDSRFTKLYFIEQDQDTAAELKRALDEREPESGRFDVLVGDTNIELPKVVQRHSRAAPIFVFLDTDSIEPRWSTVQAIAGWQTELLINFPLGFALNRNPDSGKLSEYFGTDEWRDAWQHSTRALLDLYKRRLQEIGYNEQIEDDRLISTESGGRGHRLYYLIPVSKHPAARTIWSWVFRQPEASGQARLRL